MKLTTCQMSQAKVMRARGWTVVDVTVKSGDKAFAPTWAIVTGYKKGTVSASEYFKAYRDMMRGSVKKNPFSWKRLLSKQNLCLACYCPPGNFCHRYILAGFITRYAKKQGVEVEIVPEEKLYFGREAPAKPQSVREGLAMCLNSGDFYVGNVAFKRQNPNGTSRLAKMVRKGHLKAEQIAWCLRELENAPPIWKGCMIRAGKDYFFDLQTESGSKGLVHWMDTFMRNKKLEENPLENLEQVSEDKMEDLNFIKAYGGGMVAPVEGYGKYDVVTHLYFTTENMDQAKLWATKMVRDRLWPETAMTFCIIPEEDFSEYACKKCGGDTEWELFGEHDHWHCTVCEAHGIVRNNEALDKLEEARQWDNLDNPGWPRDDD